MLNKKKKFFQIANLLIFLSILGIVACAQKSVGSSTIGLSKKAKEIIQVELVKISQLIKQKQFHQAMKSVDSLLNENKRIFKFYLIKARILHQEGKTQDAMDYLTDEIKRHPEWIDLVAIRGQFLLEAGYIESAKEDFQFAAEHNLRSEDILAVLSDIERQNNNFPKALELIKRAIEYHPKSDSLWFKKAKLELGVVRLEDAKQSSEKTLELSPNNFNYHQYYIEILGYLKQKLLLEQQIISTFRRFPDNSWISMRYSALLIEKGDLAKSKQVIQFSLEKHPKNYLLMFQLATILAAEKDWKASIGYFEKGLKFNRKSTWAKVQLAKLYIQTGNAETAVKYLRQARKEQTRDAFVYEKLAKMYNRQNDTFEAERIILEGLFINSKNRNLILEYANLLEKRGKYKEAIIAYEQVLKQKPDDYFILGRLGNLYRIAKNYPDALRHFEQALILKPSASWVRSYYIELLTNMEKWQDALVEIDQLLKIVPDDYWAYAKKALIETNLDNNNEAFKAIEKAIQLRPDILSLKEIKAQVLSRLRQYKQAEKVYQNILKKTPDSAFILTKLGYVQLHINKTEALQTVKKTISVEDSDIKTIELYLYLTDTVFKIWGFEKESLEYELYENIMLMRFKKANELSIKLQKMHSKHAPLLSALLDYYKKDNQIHLDKENIENSNLDNQWFYFYLGMNELNLDHSIEAKALFKKGLALNPDNEWIMIKLALVYQQLRQNIEAIDLIKKYLKKKPGYENNWIKLRLALNYDLVGQYKEAEEVYRLILSKNPNNNIALNNLAWMYLTAKDPKIHRLDEALKLSVKAVKNSPTAANLDTLAEAFFQKKEYHRALKTIERALDIDRQSLDDFKKTKKKIIKAIESSKK